MSSPPKRTRFQTEGQHSRRTAMKQVIVITGASSGFGALTARTLAKAGHIVYASMRDTAGRNAPQVEAAAKFAKENKVDLRTIELDVASQASADAAIQRILRDNGHLDVVIHNAGHMVYGPAEAFTPEQLAELYDVNVLSTQRVNRAALPQLRKQKHGLVVWVSSSSAAGGTPPYLAPYFAAMERKSPPDADAGSVADTIVKVVDAPFGKRPFRVHVDPTQDGADVAFAVIDRVRTEMLHRVGLSELLTPARAESGTASNA